MTNGYLLTLQRHVLHNENNTKPLSPAIDAHNICIFHHRSI